MTEQRKTFIPDENETIIQMEIERLKTFKDHPFKVENDDEVKLLKESIAKVFAYCLWEDIGYAEIEST